MRGSHLGNRGSALLLALFVCLACGALCLSLCALLSLANEARITERAGYELRGQAEVGMAWARGQCLRAWGPAAGDSDQVRTIVEELRPDEPLRMEARVTVGSRSGEVREHADLEVRALIESGFDGPPLPLAAVVADFCTASPGRTDPIVHPVPPADPGGGYPTFPGSTVAYPVPVFLCLPELPMDVTCAQLQRLATPWRFDEGTLKWLDAYPEGRNGAVVILRGRKGERLHLPDAGPYAGAVAGFIMVLGGADLDLQGQGALVAVVVVDNGSLYLEGTQLRGAAIVTDIIHFGESGAVVFDPTVLRLATDHSLARVRLVPGSRRETWFQSAPGGAGSGP